MSQKTVTFNVGGTTFEITKDLFNAYPKSALYKLVNQSSSSFSSRFSSSKQTIFLDHNPSAFSVVLDYIRHKRLHVPKNVAREVVELQLKEFGLVDDINQSVAKAFGDSKQDEKGGMLKIKGENSLPSSLPSYEQALNGFSAPYFPDSDRKEEEIRHSNDGIALKDAVMFAALKRYDFLEKNFFFEVI